MIFDKEAVGLRNKNVRVAILLEKIRVYFIIYSTLDMLTVKAMEFSRWLGPRTKLRYNPQLEEKILLNKSQQPLQILSTKEFASTVSPAACKYHNSLDLTSTGRQAYHAQK